VWCLWWWAHCSLQHELVESVGNAGVVETDLMTVLPGLTVALLMRLNSPSYRLVNTVAILQELLNTFCIRDHSKMTSVLGGGGPDSLPPFVIESICWLHPSPYL
jgi:hypothetical protein